MLIYLILVVPIASSKDRCGENYGNCDSGECCSLYNWCGTTEEHCGTGCQSKYGVCNSIIIPDDDFQPGTGKIEWAGFRFSLGGVTSQKNYGKVPDGNSWVNYVNKMKSHFNGDAKPTVIVIVSENWDDTINGFGFPAPAGYQATKYIKYQSTDRFEKILTKFDEEGFNVWLQVEPGDNDLVELAKIVFKKYGHHSCVKGFGIDLEWWYKSESSDGKKLSDSVARKVVNYVRSINPNYTVFAKHWLKSKMPDTYRDGMIFIDDSQEFDSMNYMKSEFGNWAKAFPNNPVFFQIGYPADEHLWIRSPVDFANNIINEVTKYNKHVGIIWVDFTMKQALNLM